MKKRYKILAFVILLTVITISAVAAYVYSEYVPRVLVDDSLTLKENHQWQFDLFVFGNRNVNITVSTVKYDVSVTFWYQQNQAATTYLLDKKVTRNDSLRNPIGRIGLLARACFFEHGLLGLEAQDPASNVSLFGGRGLGPNVKDS